mmetsp:Transcript_7283/g.21502  ORF Transcript_7283/g.21502 Transcript_7283/m.21502 type:complete len:214 (-) Transcript_7283:929-1570(-)
MVMPRSRSWRTKVSPYRRTRTSRRSRGGRSRGRPTTSTGRSSGLPDAFTKTQSRMAVTPSAWKPASGDHTPLVLKARPRFRSSRRGGGSTRACTALGLGCSLRPSAARLVLASGSHTPDASIMPLISRHLSPGLFRPVNWSMTSAQLTPTARWPDWRRRRSGGWNVRFRTQRLFSSFTGSRLPVSGFVRQRTPSSTSTTGRSSCARGEPLARW